MSISKPILRAHSLNDQVKTLFVVGAISFASALAYKHLVAEPRKRRYAEFYKTYDPEEHEKALQKYGLLRTFQTQDN